VLRALDFLSVVKLEISSFLESFWISLSWLEVRRQMIWTSLEKYTCLKECRCHHLNLR
jgi:hypothetical protein